MLSHRIIPLKDEKSWNLILESLGGGDVYYRPEYLRALKNRGEGEPLLIVAGEGDPIGCHACMMRQIGDDAEQDRFQERVRVDLISPYGYAGPLLKYPDAESAAVFLECWRNAAAELGAVSEFVRFHPLLETHRPFERLLEIPKVSETVWIGLQKKDLENELTDTCRRNVRTAVKKGVSVEFRGHEALGRFKRLYDETMQRKDAREYYYFDEKYYDDLARGFGGSLWVVFAMHEGIDVAGTIVLRHRGFLHYHLSGTRYEKRSLYGVNLMLLRIAERGRDAGANIFHLGGGLSPGDSLFQFKAGFSNRRGFFHIGRFIYDSAEYQELADLRKEKGSLDENFFPLYRSPIHPPR